MDSARHKNSAMAVVIVLLVPIARATPVHDAKFRHPHRNPISIVGGLQSVDPNARRSTGVVAGVFMGGQIIHPATPVGDVTVKYLIPSAVHIARRRTRHRQIQILIVHPINGPIGGINICLAYNVRFVVAHDIQRITGRAPAGLKSPKVACHRAAAIPSVRIHGKIIYPRQIGIGAIPPTISPVGIECDGITTP